MRLMTAKDVMSRTVLTVREDQTLKEAAEILSANEISGAPVEDDEGSLLGVISLTDVVRSLGGKEGGGAAVRELEVRQIMTPIADTVSEDTAVSEIARMMGAHHYHRMVVTRQEKPVGIVSSMDLLRLIAEM